MMNRSSASAVLVRLLSYAAVAAAGFELLVRAAAGSSDVRWLVRDDGPLENAQLAAVAASAALLFLLSRRWTQVAELLRLLACLATLAALRELDNFTLQLGWRTGYLWAGVPVVAYALAQVVHAGRGLGAQIEAFVRTPAFVLLAAGFFVIVVYAQLIGQKAMWIAALGPDGYRPTKDLVEESSEMLGYLLILFGAAEAWVTEGRAR